MYVRNNSLIHTKFLTYNIFLWLKITKFDKKIKPLCSDSSFDNYSFKPYLWSKRRLSKIWVVLNINGKLSIKQITIQNRKI